MTAKRFQKRQTVGEALEVLPDQRGTHPSAECCCHWDDQRGAPARWHLVTSRNSENNSENPWFSEHLGLALETWPGAHWWWGLAPSQSLHPDWIPYALCGTYALCYGHFYALHCFHPFSVRREKRRNTARHNWCHIFCTEKTLKWIRNNLNTVKHPVVRKHWIRKDFITRSVNACIPFPFHRVKTAAKV